MGFSTPMYDLSKYLEWTTNGNIQLPDFQRGYKWEDERIRSLLVTILRGHPLGIVMLLETGSDQVRFKPRPIEGAKVSPGTEPAFLLLDGQQRLTSLTQALTGNGVVATKDDRGKRLERRYFVHMATALEGEDRIDEALISVPADGVIRTNFGRDVLLDLSTTEKEQAEGYFPLRLLYEPVETLPWIFGCVESSIGRDFYSTIVTPASRYRIPAVELDSETGKSAVATVFEKVNTGGLQLTVFELLTAIFAGDKTHFDQTGTDFRLNDDWRDIQKSLSQYPVLGSVDNTDFLQVVTLLSTRNRNLRDRSTRPAAISAKREDTLKLKLGEYLEWRGPVRDAFQWAATFLADLHIFDVRFLPYPKQLVPLAAIRVVLGKDADLRGVKKRIVQWYWCGILGELYGGANETRFARDLDQVPAWATDKDDASQPKTVTDAGFLESRFYSLRTRNSAAYKGIYALLLGEGAKDWMLDKAFDKVQYTELKVDIHHIFPYQWCLENGIDAELRESIVNKTPLSAQTNRTIGGSAPSRYLAVIERKAQIDGSQLDELVATHAASSAAMRADDFDAHFAYRLDRLVELVENATGKTVQRDEADGAPTEMSNAFELENEIEVTMENELNVVLEGELF
ncbi:DUF262 domain-containing protein [Cryobacterium breve]|uniref:DUF262 domain-containing protein n=1 Tax=Cryobacterium breve TaxID=1259258 RepID=A0ABY7NBG6_9MICO|nr:DUF262 domain-containing protein [Cryobacterium breve]WBM79846.1 DUF262 domain-containing protein [Cryobacterium breve]